MRPSTTGCFVGDPLHEPPEKGDRGMQVRDSIIDAVGGTPLVRLGRVGREVAPTILAKVEYLNPGGSIKDRICLSMIEQAERDGLLEPGGTIVEPTSGNTGVGLAIVAALKGYKCILVMTDKQSPEKAALLRAYGAEVVVTTAEAPPDSPQSYYSVANRLTAEIPGAYQPNQYCNQANPDAHYRTTGPEIWEQTDGRVDVVVAGLGTGGTISGTGRYLKEQNPNIQIVGVDPVGSIFTSSEHRSYLLEGVGQDLWPPAFDASVVDRYVTVSDRDAFRMTRRLAREEALLVGGSAGMAVVGALEVAKDLPAGATVVVLLPDSGRAYLSKIYSDGWMRAQGFLDADQATHVGQLLHGPGALPPLVTISAHASVREAIELLHRHGISQLPVVSAEAAGESNPRMDAVAGCVVEATLLERLLGRPEVVDARVAEIMEAPLPTLDADAPLEAALEVLAPSGRAAALMVTRGNAVVGVVSRVDVLEHLAGAIGRESAGRR